jgi:ribonuclease HI
VNRLRMWGGTELGYQCLAESCRGYRGGTTAHLVWGCPVARAFWEVLRSRWGKKEPATAAEKADEMKEVFGYRLTSLPEWLVCWGTEEKVEPWGDLHKTDEEMWVVGVAVTLSMIWRRNVDQVHEEAGASHRLKDAAAQTRGAVREAFLRYRMGLLPVTTATITRLRVAVCKHWVGEERPALGPTREKVIRIGFFDGGSRSNPGPGGSGSVVVQLNNEGHGCRPIWAAATVSGHCSTTNNVAEFVGLQRLLQHAVEQGWRYLHVVGDSEMILRMMTLRKPPKAKGLKHWFHVTSRLADICRVASWTHHYRRFNKMADWLANKAVDGQQSVAEEFTHAGWTRRLQEGMEERMESDVEQWREGETETVG